MTAYTASVTIKFESEKGELDLNSDIEEAIWTGLRELEQVGYIEDASHVDVEVGPDEEE